MFIRNPTKIKPSGDIKNKSFTLPLVFFQAKRDILPPPIPQTTIIIIYSSSWFDFCGNHCRMIIIWMFAYFHNTIHSSNSQTMSFCPVTSFKKTNFRLMTLSITNKMLYIDWYNLSQKSFHNHPESYSKINNDNLQCKKSLTHQREIHTEEPKNIMAFLYSTKFIPYSLFIWCAIDQHNILFIL